MRTKRVHDFQKRDRIFKIVLNGGTLSTEAPVMDVGDSDIVVSTMTDILSPALKVSTIEPLNDSLIVKVLLTVVGNTN